MIAEPTTFGYRARFVPLQVLIGVTFPLVAVGLAVGGIVALIDGVPFNGGTVAFAAAWSLGARATRACHLRPGRDTTRCLGRGQRSGRPMRTLRFGDGPTASTRGLNTIGRGFDDFLRQVSEVQKRATSPRSP